MRTDVQIICNALANFWDIDPEYQPQIIAECDRLIEDRGTDAIARQNLINWRYKRVYAPSRPSAA